ncbi:glycosyltransferase family 4 protein [bacterium]|jgi:glycosyltransferase involved in cell wall biosynthesis|nr:glycosyltransferase family 4 protein [bacterium]
MNLIIDVQMIDVNSGGALTYIKNMLFHIFKNKENNITIYLIANKKNIDALDIRTQNIFKIIKPKINTSSALNRFIYSYFLIKFIDITFNKDDILWMPFNTGLNLRTKKVKSILTVHDFLVFDYPNCVPLFNRIFRKFSLTKSIKNANIIITVSNYTKQQLYVHCNHLINNKTVKVIYESADTNVWNLDKKINNQNKEKFILFVGVGRKNKNLEFLLESFKILIIKYNYSGFLYIAGGVNAKYKKQLIELSINLSIEKKVKFLGFIADDDLKKFYQSTDTFVFPSYYEGFGLPILEANACGAKVCCSDATSLEEVGDNFTNYFNPFNQEECANVINFTLKDKYISHNKEIFSWEKSALEFLNLINDGRN